MQGCLRLQRRRAVRQSRDRTETVIRRWLREDGSTRNGVRRGGALSLLVARPFRRSTQLFGFESEPGLALQTDERRLDGEVLVQFTLLGY